MSFTEYNSNEFEINSGNREAYDLCRSIITEDKRGCFIALHGPAQCGKTHLIKSILSGYKRQFPSRRVGYTNYDRIMDNVFSSAYWEYEIGIHKELSLYDVYVIDDLQFLSGKPSTQMLFAEIVKEVLQLGGNVLVAFKCPVEDLRLFLDDIGSDDICQVVELEKAV